SDPLINLTPYFPENSMSDTSDPPDRQDGSPPANAPGQPPPPADSPGKTGAALGHGSAPGKSKETVEDFFYHYTGSIGSLVRQLALAGIAVVWLLHTGELNRLADKAAIIAAASDTSCCGLATPEPAPSPPPDPARTMVAYSLKVATFALVASLVAEALQYFLGSLFWGIQFMFGNNPAGPINRCKIRLYILFALVNIKTICVVVGLGAIAYHLRGLVFDQA
ncbi:MAG: hypothetical protein AAGL98_07655, partial [Planctomycetota bacterium]